MSTLDEIRQRAEAATKGPWHVERHDLTLYVADGTGVLDPIKLGYVGNRPERNAEFIAHARTDVPRLLAALDAVLAVHQPMDALMYGSKNAHKVQVCTGCGQDDGNWNRYPCPTVRAINNALEAGK